MLRFHGKASGAEQRYRLLFIGDVHESYLNAARSKTAFDVLAREGKKQGFQIVRLGLGDLHTGRSPRNWPLNIRVNAMFRFAVQTLGNQDSYMPLAAFVEGLLQWGRSIFLVSNLLFPVDTLYQQLIQKHLIKTGSALVRTSQGKCGVIAITGPFWPDNVRRYNFPVSEPLTRACIAREVEALKKQGAQPIILIAHAGSDWGTAFAQTPESQGIDGMITADDHRPVPGRTVIRPDGTPIVIANAGAYGDWVGVMDLVVRNGKTSVLQSTLHPSHLFPKDKTVEALLHQYIPDLSPIARIADTDLNGQISWLRQAYFLADTARQVAGAQIGMIRANEFRRILKQEVTPVELGVSIPYVDPLVKAELRGGDIRAAISRSAENIALDAWKPFLFPAGIDFQLEGNRPVHVRVEVQPGQWAPLEDDKLYSVALCKYIVEGEKAFPSLNQPAQIRWESPLAMAGVFKTGLQQLAPNKFSNQPWPLVTFPPLPAGIRWLETCKTLYLAPNG